MKLDLIQYSDTDGWQPALTNELDSEQTMVLVFGAASFRDKTDIFEQLQNTFSHSHILGCSTAGEIFGTVINDETLSIAVIRFDHTTLKQHKLQINNSSDSYSAGKQITEALNSAEIKGIFVLSDGLSVNGSELIRGINQNLDDSVVVTGGLAGDGDRFESTWVIDNGSPMQQQVSAIAFYGDKINIQHGSKGGWESFGPKRLITKSMNNVLYELDGQPALTLYKEYLGERASGLPATALLFPLAIHSNSKESDYIVRTILSIDEEKQSMTFAGDIPENHYAQLMRADFERLIDGAYDAAKMANNMNNADGDILNIAISCVGRRLVLGERSEDEVEATLETLPEGTKQIGFYSYGEISPYVSGQACQLHNQTMTLTTLSESP